MGGKTFIRKTLEYVLSWGRGRKLDKVFPMRVASPAASSPANDVQDYFLKNTEGPGIWKWEHYFEIYDRHLARFRGKSPVIVEIGVYSGGSLGMWQSYFGPGTQVVGIDIEPACKVYEREGVKIVIGDQADRNFWAQFRKDFARVDILIDDGGHRYEQQATSLEEMLPHMAQGGVYICEDIQQRRNAFMRMVCGFADGLNLDAGGVASGLQKAVKGITLYPYVAVFELHAHIPPALFSTKRGTEWQPFYD